MALAEDVMEIPALGRPFQLGMLYDCRKDALIPGITLWDHCSLQKDLTIKPQPKTESEILASDAIDDKASALDISANLKASFLGGLVEVGGSAKYLQDTKKSKQQARVTVQYKATTRYEQLTMSHLGIQNISHPAIFEQGMATHVVTAILYGAQAFFVFDREVSSTEIVKSIKGKLQVTIKKMLSVGGTAAVKLNKEETENILQFSCKFHGDFSLERNPVTVQDAVQVYATLPKMLGECGENAVPVRVWLFPLTKLDTKATKMVREISLALIFDVEKVLEELDEIQMQSNDLANNPVAESFLEIKEKIQQFKDLLKQHRQTFQKQLARVLPSIRGGGQEEETLVDLLTSVNQSPFNGRRLREFLDTKKREMNFVKSYLTILDDIEVISSPNMLEEIILDSPNGYVVVFIFTSLHKEEPFLFTLQDWLREQFMPGSAKSTRSTPGVKKGTAWFEDQERTQKARQAAKSIQDFFSVNQSNEAFRFVVASLPDVETPGASIYLYEDGELVSKNFELPSKPLPFLTSELRHDSIQLKFQPAEYGKATISSYLVEYKVAGKENSKTVRTEDTRETFLLKDLLPNTEYQIQYAACCKLGLSKFSDTTAPVKTLPSSPPEKEFHLQGERRAEVGGPHRQKIGPREEEQESCIPIPPWPEDDGEDAELRLILVGKSGGGKSATGNTILGRPVFKSILQPNTTTLKCERGQGSWHDQKVSVVDTPNIFDSENHKEAMRHEIGACVELSQPGPHALIFVTQVGHFTAEDVTAAKRVRAIFGDESARHTIVLFTYLEDLGGISLQEYLQMSDNRNLRKLISGCRGHFCGFNNKAAGAKWKAQVSELMEMVQRVVSENRGRHYVIRLHKGPMKSPDSACANRPEMAGSIQGPERRIVLIGRTGTGKSATGNTILGSKVFGMLPMSDTKRCQKEAMVWNGRRIVVVDTPGFLDTGRPERANTAEVSELCSPGPHIILWVMCSGSFSQEEKDMARMIKGILNPKARNYMIVLLTHKDKLEGCSSGHFMYCQDQKKYIAECGNRYLTFNNMAKGNEREAQMAELMKMIDQLVFENGDAVYYTEAMLTKDIENFRRSRASFFCPIV